MKIKWLLPLCLLAASTASAQSVSPAPGNTVVLTGIAEASREPDYIIVAINNRESQKSKSDDNATAEKEGELIQTLLALKVDTAKLTIQRFSTDGYNNWLSFGKSYSLSKTYYLRIDDLRRYEDIIVGIAKAGFKNINVIRSGLNDAEAAEGVVIRKAIAAGQAKANAISSSLSGRKLRLTGIEELENDFRRQQGTRNYSYYDGESLGVAGGLSNSPLNLSLGRIILHKVFRMTYVFE